MMVLFWVPRQINFEAPYSETDFGEGFVPAPMVTAEAHAGANERGWRLRSSRKSYVAEMAKGQSLR